MSQYQQLDVVGGPRAAEQDKPAAEPNEELPIIMAYRRR
jgi:hypothetical protein